MLPRVSGSSRPVWRQVSGWGGRGPEKPMGGWGLVGRIVAKWLRLRGLKGWRVFHALAPFLRPSGKWLTRRTFLDRKWRGAEWGRFAWVESAGALPRTPGYFWTDERGRRVRLGGRVRRRTRGGGGGLPDAAGPSGRGRRRGGRWAGSKRKGSGGCRCGCCAGLRGFRRRNRARR